MKFAAIDIGSNAIRLLIEEIHANGDTWHIEKVSLTRVPVRLGDNVFRKGKISREKTRQLTKAFHAQLPFVPFTPAYAWCGTFGNTENGLPIIDRDEQSGAWFVLGMGGNGITFSQVGAQIVRDSIMGRTNEAAALFSFRDTR